MTTYAKGTRVPIARTREHIEGVPQRYGADKFLYFNEGHRAVIAFAMQNRNIRLALEMPAYDEFAYTATRRRRAAEAQKAAHEQACRERWRSLLPLITAKLEGVASGISTLETEFLAHIALPSGETVGDWMLPQIEQTYSSQQMPPMLPPGRTD